MPTTIKYGYLPPNSVHYVEEEEDEYFFEYAGTQNWLTCNKNHGIQVVYDQVYRHMYFNYNCKVILSHHFYDFQDAWVQSQANKGYKMVGFFR